MSNITIYSTTYCPYCVRAKTLLKNKNASYNEIIIDEEGNEDKREEMIKRSNGRKTVPQIFINSKHIGGFDDLNALDKKGELSKLLN